MYIGKKYTSTVRVFAFHIIWLKIPMVAAIYCRISKVKKWTHIGMEVERDGWERTIYVHMRLDVVEQK